MEKKKILIITLIIALVLVLSTITIPTIIKRSKKKSALKAQAAQSSRQASYEKSYEPPVERRRSQEAAAADAASAEPSVQKAMEAEAKWMEAFLSANRTWGRSPFLRKGEGMGKILILSSPSSADIFIDGVKMPNQTNWLTPLTLPPKKYHLEIRKEGYYSHQQELVVTAGIEEFRDINTINVTLEKKPVDAEDVAAEIWRQLKRPALYVSMIVFDEEKPSALIVEYDPESPPPEGEAISNRVVFEGDRFTLPGSDIESKRVFLVKNIFLDHVILEDTLVNWDYRLEIYKEAK